MLAYAPPELSEPAITRIRFGAIVRIVYVIVSVAHVHVWRYSRSLVSEPRYPGIQ
jgi:hypothetical protein